MVPTGSKTGPALLAESGEDTTRAEGTSAGRRAPRSPKRHVDASPTSFSLRAPHVIDGGSNAGLECPFEDPHRPKGADATPPREGRRLLDVRGAFHRQEPMCTGDCSRCVHRKVLLPLDPPLSGRPPLFDQAPEGTMNAVGILRRTEEPRLWYRTLSPDFDCVGRCSLPGGPSRGTDPTRFRGFPRRGRASIVRLGRPGP